MSGIDREHPPPIIDLECGQFSTPAPKHSDESTHREGKHSKGSVRLALPKEEADEDNVCWSTANDSTCQQLAQSPKGSVSMFTPLDQSKASKQAKGKQAASGSTSSSQEPLDEQPSTANVQSPEHLPSLNGHSENRPNGSFSPHRTPPGALDDDADELCQWVEAPADIPESPLVANTNTLSTRNKIILAPNVRHALASSVQLDYAQIERNVGRLWSVVTNFSTGYESLKNEFHQVKEKLCIDVRDATHSAVTRGTTYVQGFGAANARSLAAQEASREAMESAQRALLQLSSLQMHVNTVSKKAESQAMGIRSKMEGIEHRSCETASDVEKLAQDTRRIEEQSNEHKKKSLELLDEVAKRIDMYKSNMRKDLAALGCKVDKFIDTTKASEKQHIRAMQDMKDKSKQLHSEAKSNLEQIEGKFDTKLGEFDTELKEKLAHMACNVEYNFVELLEKLHECICDADGDARKAFRFFKKKLRSNGAKESLKDWKGRLWPTVDTESTVSSHAESSTQAQERERKKRKRDKSASSSSRRKRQQDSDLRNTPPEE